MGMPRVTYFELQVVVENVASNQAGTELTDQGGFSYWNDLSQEQSLTPAVHEVTVSEPGLQVEKVASPLAVFPSGGTVTFTVTVTNPAGAYVAAGQDVRVQDILPVAYGNLQVLSIVPTGIEAQDVHDNTSGTVLDVQVDHFPVGGQLVITYTADASAQPQGTLLKNTAVVRWTSLPGDNGTGDATPGAPGTQSGERTGSETGPNDYYTSDTEQVVVGAINVVKRVVDAQPRYMPLGTWSPTRLSSRATGRRATMPWSVMCSMRG